MDYRGHIHELQALAISVSDDERRDLELQRRRLEEQVGKLVPIPAAELDVVKAMPLEERRAWYVARTTATERKAARKAQRAARKRQRRAR